jgi:hypothetical protein
METFQAIDLRQTRDFGRKVNATFEFIRQNFLPLSKSILFIAGPPILLASILVGSFFGDVFSLTSLAAGGNSDMMQQYIMSPGFWSQIALVFIFILVSGVCTIATINNYIVLYDEKKSNRIEVSEVWARVRDTFWMYLRTMVMFTVLGIIAYIVLIIPMVALAAISPFLIFFGVIIMFGGILYLAIGSSLVFIIRAYENIGFIDSLRRSFSLMEGKWWSTFGLIMILYTIVMFVSYFFILGWSVITMVTAFHDADVSNPADMSSTVQTMTIVFFAVYYLIQMVLYSLPNVGLAFQYFNLVERKEAASLIKEIETIGQPPASDNAQDEHY